MSTITQLINGLVFGIGFGFSTIILLILFDRYIAWKNEKNKAEYLREKRKKKQNGKQRNN